MKETKEAFNFLLKLVDGIIDARSDGKINWMDLTKLIPAFMVAEDGIAGADKILKEINTATVAERMDFETWLRSEFSIEENKPLEDVIEDGVFLLMNISRYINKISSLKKL